MCFIMKFLKTLFISLQFNIKNKIKENKDDFKNRSHIITFFINIFRILAFKKPAVFLADKPTECTQ